MFVVTFLLNHQDLSISTLSRLRLLMCVAFIHQPLILSLEDIKGSWEKKMTRGLPSPTSREIHALPIKLVY